MRSTLRFGATLALALSCGAGAWIGSAMAAVAPVPAQPPIPPMSDAWLSFVPGNGFIGPFGFTEVQETPGGTFGNTGIQTSSQTGDYVELLEGCCGHSDYIVANVGFLYFSSDDDTGKLATPKDITGVNGKSVGILTETGKWQEITNKFTWPVAGTQVWVASDPPEVIAPAPAALPLMGSALTALGLLVRKRSV